MTREEFGRTRFCMYDKIKYDGEWHDIASIDFSEDLVAWKDESGALVWVRCESIENYLSAEKKEALEKLADLTDKEKTILLEHLFNETDLIIKGIDNWLRKTITRDL